MARGQAGKADSQLNTTNKAAAGYSQAAEGLFGPLTEEGKKLTQSTGFDPATLGAITNAGMGGVNAAFGDAENQLNRSVARTGNPAGIGGQLDALARSKGIAGGKEAGDIQIANANERDKLRGQGLDLLNSLYGTNVGASNQLFGLGPATLGARAAGGGWSQGFKDVLGSISSAGHMPQTNG